MTYTPPENHVIYESDPEKAAALLNSNTGYAPATFDPAIATYRPRPWTRFYNLYSPPGNLTDGTAFLHAMRTPSGNRRLVVIDVAPPLPPGGYSSSQGPPALQVRVFRPATFTAPPVELRNTRRSLWGGWDVRRIRAGRIEQQDPSHFTLEVELLLDDARLTVDGWLRDDDTVIIQPRPPSQ